MTEYVPFGFFVAPKSAKLACLPFDKVATPDWIFTIEVPSCNSTGLAGETATTMLAPGSL